MVDPNMHFEGFEKKFYKQVFFFCIAVTVSHGQIPVEFYADGNNVRETGVRHYTTWNNGNGDRYVVCSTYTSAQLQIDIYHENADVNGKYNADADTNLKEYTIDGAPAGIYTCRIEAVSVSSNGYNLTYNLESRLQLTRSARSSFCETNKGRSGFTGEEIIMICNGDRNRWTGMDSNEYSDHKLAEMDVFLSPEVLNEYICVDRNDRKVCDLTEFTVLSSLTVQIMPNSFTSDSEVLNFTCTSSPPRLLYWRVLGSKGDILDLDQQGASLKVDTYIDIEQSVGKTSILISEEIPGHNEIYAVICFTYQTKTRAAVARLVQLNKTNRLVTDTSRVTKEPSIGTDLIPGGKDKDEISGSLYVTQSKDTTDPTVQTSNVDVIFIVFIVILTVIIIVLIFCWLGSHYFAKRKAANESKMDAKVETSEPTLYDNPAYGSNSEYQADKSDVTVDKEYTYIDH